MSPAKLLVCVALAACCAGAAFADTLGVLYENTLTLTDAKGGVRTMRIAADHRFEQTGPNGIWAGGPWEVDDSGRFCFSPRGETTMCIPLPADKEVGDEWEVRGPTGQLAWTARIVEGRGETAPKE